MDCMKLPSQRGPVRASLLNHPRIPRHLLRQQPGEGEQKTVAKLADQGDSGSEHVPLLGKKELSVVEKHQLQAPAQMMAQLRRNSLNQQGSAAGQVPQLHSSISTPQGMVTTSACLQGLPDSGKESLNPQCDRTAQQGEQHSVIDGSTVRRRQLIHSVLEERGSKEGEGGSAITTSPPVTKTQCSTSSGEGQETRRPPLSVNSLESESLKNHLPFSVKNKVANSNTAPPFPIVRRNSLQDIQSALVSDSGSVSTGSKTNIPLEAVKPTATC
ncbi:uncharacterized protein LOC143300295 [Babylonia areolata]|uniref:uncharacterized protein LOC143300295 n=1 Tax=Babylonia areolata TaxID=304850 RepID=UPI003FD1D2D6